MNLRVAKKILSKPWGQVPKPLRAQAKKVVARAEDRSNDQLPAGTTIRPNHHQVPVPQWLTVEALQKAQLVWRWGYERVRISRNWQLHTTSTEVYPFTRYEQKLVRVASTQKRGNCLTDNKTTSLLNIDGHLVFVSYWDANIYIGLTVIPSLYGRLPDDWDWTKYGHLVNKSS